MNKTIESTDEAWDTGLLGSDENFVRISDVMNNNDTGQAANDVPVVTL